MSLRVVMDRSPSTFRLTTGFVHFFSPVFFFGGHLHLSSSSCGVGSGSFCKPSKGELRPVKSGLAKVDGEPSDCSVVGRGLNTRAVARAGARRGAARGASARCNISPKSGMRRLKSDRAAAGAGAARGVGEGARAGATAGTGAGSCPGARAGGAAGWLRGAASGRAAGPGRVAPAPVLLVSPAPAPAGRGRVAAAPRRPTASIRCRRSRIARCWNQMSV